MWNPSRLLYLVEFTNDHSTDPRDDDTLSDTDLAAWLVGDWRYITATLTAVIAGQRVDDTAAEFVDIRFGETLDWTYDTTDLIAQIIASGACDLVIPGPARTVYRPTTLAA